MFAYLTPTGITQKSQPNLTIKGNTVKPLVNAYESFRTMLGRNCASLAYGDGRDFNSSCFKIFYSCEKSISRKKICYFLLRNFLHLYNPGMPDPYLGAICVFWGERRLDTRVITLPHLNPPYYPIFSSQKTRNSYWVWVCRNAIMFQHLITQFTLYCLSSGCLQEGKNKRKFQTFSSKSGCSHVWEVVTYKRFQV